MDEARKANHSDDEDQERDKNQSQGLLARGLHAGIVAERSKPEGR